MKKVIHTKNAPAAIGPYSQAVAVGDFLFVSGQIAIDPETGEIPEGVEKQTEQVMKNLQAILTEAEYNFEDAVKFTIYIKSMDDFPKINEVYASFLQKPYPARATIEVSRLPKDVLVEIDVVASKSKK